MIQNPVTDKKIAAKPPFLFGGFVFLAAALCAFLLVLTACASAGSGRGHAVISADSYIQVEKSLYVPEVENIEWKRFYSGAEYFFFENKDFPVRYHCVKIDLSDPSVKISAFPSSKDEFHKKKGKTTEFFTGIRAGKLAKKTGSEIIVNTTPFAGKSGTWNLTAKLTSTRKIVGVHIVEKQLISKPIERYAALLINKTDRGFEARIVASQKENAFENCDFAFGGFFEILKDYKKSSFDWISHDSRTAIGITEDKKTLFLLVVEGEFQSKSKGLSYPECADIMLALGARDALEMDGGGSSALFISGKNMLSYPAMRISATYLCFDFITFD